ncbi:Stk1 family PASTA domain-containing Ser/Thr kinase [Cryobacterium psychrophilum]|uniref:non-specific serine/threonine protein kinase n=1 Tax=Cryobacterium psychrophilum TaxID=41988 RepID=A0A4Y8KTZ9_9MICO|nr:Stk1 family PASTA domain-containing Ser/Thr kinase [Cryobacterium psychrophilum]TDW31478.1 serine/threonine-protein kinase [Cryobacterium psychrophilum]TFD78910.1 Stk1 family PASTA domain-containing Ser/Thr kinase [Cryobacterium psychrophilum]
MSETPTDQMIGRLIDGRYQVRSRIARGGMATVYLATDLRLERRVAIKIMHGHLADDNAFKSRFIQEARSAARLAHPNVVNVFDQGQDADTAYLVMEYLPGITLRDLLKDYGKLTPEQTVDILEAVLSGLAAAHKAGIVHRDVKPENVLLADDGRIKISDFGLARAVNNNTATGQALLGTIAYLSPELVTRGIADARSDIYALGIMTFEMLTGEQPYVGEAPMQIAYQHANDTVPMPSSKVTSTPRELDELVQWATARDPEQRPRDARVMLDQLLDGRGHPGAGSPGQQPTALQPTMMVPGITNAAANAETKLLTAALHDGTSATSVLGPMTAAGVIPQSPDNSTALATKARRRKNRGFWLFALVLLIATALGSTGWYFGSGPGSDIAVPTVSTLSPSDAAARIDSVGLKSNESSVYSADVPEGVVIGTKPKDGTRVSKDSTVNVVVSLGLQPITLPPLAGLSQEDASAQITTLLAEVGSVDSIFSTSAEADTVISASRASDDGDVSEGGDYFQGLKVNLVVSLGAIPDVVGSSVAAATQALADKELLAISGEQTYSDSIAEGKVVSTTGPEAPVRAGATIILTVSRGPEPVQVPDVVGKPWSEAKQILSDAGLKLDYNIFADAAPGLFTVTKVTPGSGTSVPRNSNVKVNFSA